MQMHGKGDTATLGMAIVKEISGRNVIGLLDHGKPNTIVIGAHYDHLGWGAEGSLYRGEPAIHNGADDNASGTAALLELVRIYSKSKYDNYNYLFIAFTCGFNCAG
jgi:Zn-dependent M28 family amino/carboxypeptidase